MLSEVGVLHGRDAGRQSADRLGLQLPDAQFEFTSKQIDGEYAFLVWKAHAAKFRVEDGADSFVVRDGRIAMQSIYYRLQGEAPGGSST